MEKKYWKGLEELRNDAEFVKHKNNEFSELLPLDEIFTTKAENSTSTNRRDFLKFMGFGIAAATLAACETPVKKAIPYVVRPEEVNPGTPNYYASTYADGHDFCSILVKTREGRPIKVDGNDLCSLTKGGTSARVQASVLSLYDSGRLKTPTINGEEAAWAKVDQQITKELSDIAVAGGKVRILSSSIISPSTKAVIAEFVAKYPTTKHVTYDAVSHSAMITANEENFGKAVLPTYAFNKAELLVSVGADFLTNWISPIENSYQYAQKRKLDESKTMSRHIQIESMLSLTGSNADTRIRIAPGDVGATLLALYNKLGGSSSAPSFDAHEEVNKVAAELAAAKGKALLVCGSNDHAHQVLTNVINVLLESYGNTIDLDNPSYIRQGRDAEMTQLVNDMQGGEVKALIMYNTNPAYTLPTSMKFEDAIKKVGLTVSFADRADETASMAKYICPDHHYLESWNDAMPRAGILTLTQPTIAPIFKTRAAQESLLKWAGNDTNYYDYMRNQWRTNTYPTLQGAGTFESFWNQSLQNGIIEMDARPATFYTLQGDLSRHITSIVGNKKSEGIALVIYEKTGLGNGNQANNPWLQELPDPVTKITWDNYLCVSPAMAKEKGLRQGNVVEVKANGQTVKAPVVVQPGLHVNTVALAVGYGRTMAGKVANNIGANAYSMVSLVNGTFQMMAAAEVNKTLDADYALASTQTHHTMMGRALLKESTLAEYKQDARAGNPPVLIPVMEDHKQVGKAPKDVTLWAEHEFPNHHWGMSIDLNSCIGCGSCVVACSAENNVPVVGKDEVMRSREMHWMRIDRYYSSDADANDLKGMETASENPKVAFQPVMCQHCNHAPCETVCPVAATTHSHDGMNQMAYNRCVGTRYCANNCPFKVRRFNWFKYSDNDQFDYNMNDDLGKMVLNPDVVVRSRGVMEKCSLCVQRIQYSKLTAKKEKRKIRDGEINTACAQSCPTKAITFGDYNDKNSKLAASTVDERSYQLLEELDVRPNVLYKTKIRNINPNQA